MTFRNLVKQVRKDEEMGVNRELDSKIKLKIGEPVIEIDKKKKKKKKNTTETDGLGLCRYD